MNQRAARSLLRQFKLLYPQGTNGQFRRFKKIYTQIPWNQRETEEPAYKARKTR